MRAEDDIGILKDVCKAESVEVILKASIKEPVLQHNHKKRKSDFSESCSNGSCRCTFSGLNYFGFILFPSRSFYE